MGVSPMHLDKQFRFQKGMGETPMLRDSRRDPMTPEDRRNLRNGLLFLSPWIIGFCVFTLLPVALSLYYSFCEYALTAPDREPVWIGLENYQNFFRDELFWKSLRNTLRYAAMALPAGVLVSLGLALMLNANIRGQSIYRTAIFLPSLIPAAASAMIWLWMLNPRLGIFNHLLRLVGLAPINW